MRFADDSQAHGKVAAAVPALSRAAGLVSDARRRARILVRAAKLSSDLNDEHHARGLLDGADLRVAGPVERARLLLVSENAVFEPDEPDRRIRELLRAAGAAFEEGARDLAENLLWMAGARCFFQDADAPARPDGVSADVRDGRRLRYLGTAAIASIRWLIAPDLADAAVAAGAVAEARKLLIDLPELAGQLPSDMMTMAYAYTSAVLASGEQADQLFADGLAALPTGSQLTRARLFLQHGRRLHRQGRDARALLRTARDEFDLLGARPWAQMARAELRAAGEVISRHAVGAHLGHIQVATGTAVGRREESTGVGQVSSPRG